METNGIKEYFIGLVTENEYNGYFCSTADAITIVIVGSLCGLKNVSQIHQWATNARVSEFLKEKLGIERIPCYYWLLCLLKMIKPESLNRCFMDWVSSVMPKNIAQNTIAIDGKTVRSTSKMKKYKNPLHIISAQLSEHGLTLAQRCVDGKSNEIPAVQELIKEMDIKGCMIVADALNCQKATAEAIVDGSADYLLCVKDNHPTLKKDIEDYVQDETLQSFMDIKTTVEKNRERIEKRTAYVTSNIDWLNGKAEWKNLSCIGAIHTETTTETSESSEWHYYISNKKLSADALLFHARKEWSVESMHWLLDVHFGEDFCRTESRNTQQNLNMARKAALNIIKLFKERTGTKLAISKIMMDSLLDYNTIVRLLDF